MPLALPGDGPSGGRFGIIVINGQADRRTLEFHDGLGDLIGTQRAVMMLARCSRPTTSAPMSPSRHAGRKQLLRRAGGRDAGLLNRGLAPDESRGLVTYLRHRYELDMTEAFLPAGTFLVKADDFDGNWQLAAITPQDAARYLGGPHVTAEGKAAADGIKTTVDLPRDGTYHVWVRANENSWQAPPTNSSGLQTFVQGKELPSPTFADRGPVSSGGTPASFP